MSIKEALLVGSLPAVLGIIIGYLIGKLDKIIEKRNEIKNIKTIIGNELKENYFMVREVAESYYNNKEDVYLYALALSMLKTDRNIYFKYLDKIYLLKNEVMKDVLNVYSNIEFDQSLYKKVIEKRSEDILSQDDHSIISNSVVKILDLMEIAIDGLEEKRVNFKNIDKSSKSDFDEDFDTWFEQRINHVKNS